MSNIEENISSPFPSYEGDISGFEVEDSDEDIDDLKPVKPFDPRKVDVSITTPNMGVLINRLEHGEIDLMPDFQRSGDLWSDQAQSRLIESMLIRLPIPAFYFDAHVDDSWQVVDGLQRLSAIHNFVIKKTLRLTKLEFLKEYDGANYDQLPRSLKRRIDEFQTSVYLIKPGTPVEMKYSLFHRINTGGLKLTRQEIRHAMSQSVHNGVASKFLSNLTNEPLFCKVVGTKNNRMSYQELALRHITFTLLGHDSYKSSLPNFLDQGMEALAACNERARNSLRENFLAALQTANTLFGKDAFKKTLAEPTHKKVVNKPLFDAVSVCFASLSDDERSQLTLHQKSYVEKFKELLTEVNFHDAISRSTSNKDQVDERFSRVIKLTKDFLMQDI